MSWVLAAGGLLACLSLATREVLITLVIAGRGIWLMDLCRHSSRRMPGRSSAIDACLAGLSLILLIGLWYAPSIALPRFNQPDDFIAYLPFAKRLLQSGTLIEPFSLRRLASLGGQAILLGW